LGPAVTLPLIGSTDERLARLVADTNDRAFVALYDRHHQALYRYCRSLVRDETDAQDATQSTWARALIALRRRQRDAPVKPWLFRIAHNEAISMLRRRTQPAACTQPVDRPVASAEHQVIERERFALLVADLQELPDRPRGALIMRELSGLSHQEIATALGTSIGAAKQSIVEARRGLADFAAGRATPCDQICRKLSDGDGRMLQGRHIRAHLRQCSGCAAFAAAIGDRRATLRALVPILPAATAASILAQTTGQGPVAAATGGAGAGFAGASTVGIAGKSGAATVATKALAGAALVAATAGAVSHVAPWAHHPRRAPLAGAMRSEIARRQAGSTGKHAAPVAHQVAALPAGPATNPTSFRPRARTQADRLPNAPAARRPRSRLHPSSAAQTSAAATETPPQAHQSGASTAGSHGVGTIGSHGLANGATHGAKADGSGRGHQIQHSHGQGHATAPAVDPGTVSSNAKGAANSGGASQSTGGASHSTGGSKSQAAGASTPVPVAAPRTPATPSGRAKTAGSDSAHAGTDAASTHPSAKSH
jgi:RNA polymerase sigma factor (sigma-70 family)